MKKKLSIVTTVKKHDAFRCYAVYKVNKRLDDKVLHDMIDQLNPDLRTVDNIDGKTLDQLRNEKGK